MEHLRMPGIMKRHKIATTLAGLAVVVGGAELAGYLANPTASVPRGACESPFATTPTYVDPNGSTWKTDAGVGEGVIVRVTLPQGADGVVAGWESPGSHNWTLSDMVPATGRVALKFGIGQGDVVFGVRTVSQNPADCTAPPAIDVKWLGAGSYFDAPGRLPWPDGVNDVVNSLP